MKYFFGFYPAILSNIFIPAYRVGCIKNSREGSPLFPQIMANIETNLIFYRRSRFLVAAVIIIALMLGITTLPSLFLGKGEAFPEVRERWNREDVPKTG